MAKSDKPIPGIIPSLVFWLPLEATPIWPIPTPTPIPFTPIPPTLIPPTPDDTMMVGWVSGWVRVDGQW